jgi:antitoxin MazE
LTVSNESYYDVITKVDGVIKMKAELVRIGNSRGIRIPKPLIEECQLGETVELRIEDRRLVISAPVSSRHGWDDAFCKAASRKPDAMLLERLSANEFDREEWTW